MIQEIFALTIFAAAIFYCLYQIGRTIVPSKKNNTHGCHSESGTCRCK